jgi:hypothetical protein
MQHKKATIVIRDEVNIKIEGLSDYLKTRKRIVERCEYMVPYAYHLPAYKLGRWNGKKSYCSIGMVTYLNLLDRILPILEEDGFDIDVVDHRNNWNVSFPSFDEVKAKLASKNWPIGHPDAGKPIILRDYQEEAVAKFLENPQSVQCLSTGSGKTITSAALSMVCEPMGRTIVIVPSKTLVTQTEDDYKVLGLDVGVFYGDRKELNKTHTICTWQSLNALSARTANKKTGLLTDDDIHEFLDDVSMVLCDECFDGESLVLTPEGYKEIKNVNIGDIVINYNEENKSFKEDIVVDVYKNMVNSQTEKMYELEFDNGKIIKVTGNHKFLTNNGWKRADELTENDTILSVNDK